MFYAIEKYKLPAQILLGLIAVTFIGFGASTLAQPGHDYVVKIGDIKISGNDINDAVRRTQAAGGALNRQQVLTGLQQQAYLQQGGYDLGAEASLAQIKQLIAADAEFQDNGRFSEQKYQNFLRQNQLSEAMLIDDIRKQYAVQTVVNLLQGGILVSDVQARQVVTALQAQREIRQLVFDPARYVTEVKLDDAALKAHYEANRQQYQQPQALKFEFVVLSAKELGERGEVSEEALQQAYARLPVDASGVRPPLAEVKPALEAEIRLRQGQQQMAQQRETLADLAFNHPNELKTVADKLGLKINRHDEWLTAEAAEAEGMPAELRAALFGDDVLVKKHNSEPVVVGDSLWVVRATEVRPPRTPELAEIRTQVQQDYVAAASRKLALAAAQAALAQAEKGQGSALTWSAPSRMTAAEAHGRLAAADAQALLKARPQNSKPAYVLLGQHNGMPTLVAIDAIHAPDAAAAALAPAKQALSAGQGQAWLSAYLRQQQRLYPAKQGAQRLDTDTE